MVIRSGPINDPALRAPRADRPADGKATLNGKLNEAVDGQSGLFTERI